MGPSWAYLVVLVLVVVAVLVVVVPELGKGTIFEQTYLIFVNFGTPSHFLGLYKESQKCAKSHL